MDSQLRYILRTNEHFNFVSTVWQTTDNECLKIHTHKSRMMLFGKDSALMLP
ncbi:hypothetical protein AO366_0955 [Moraxella catarrhalis]|nr:hypothetical protein AO379_1668 [Moraxella catarrhalis]OAV18073.1 hypothetical protein AO373_1310 [Moraxella catarrhalis]OAV33680.1 hypothetical protein AO366_0955 [Moraxella catarrhalis]